MKKIILIIILFIIIFAIFYKKEQKVSIEYIDYNLEYNELGITFLDLNDSNSLLLTLNNTNILYIINYKNSKGLKKNLYRLNKKIDYIVMNKKYDINIKASKKIINERLIINNIIIENVNYQAIKYNNKTLCINSSNCDFIYFTKDNIKLNNNKAIFINRNVHMKDSLYEQWVDIYKLNNSVYTILKLKEDYEVLQIIKNI